MGRSRQVIQVTHPIASFIGRAARELPVHVVVYLDQATGPAAVQGREVRVSLTMPELADVVGAIPASMIEDPADFRAIVRAMGVLHREGKAAI